MKKMAIASDGSGLNLKEAVKKNLIDAGWEVLDVATQAGGEPMSHIQAARLLGAAIKEHLLPKSIIFCGTGGGASICMNKIRGIYCVACESMFTAPKLALINNANVLAMGGRVLGPENATEMALAFLETGFADGFAEARRTMVEAFYQEMVDFEDECFR